jgi:hypothetical protein
LRYVAAEDRVLLDGGYAKDKEVSLWLTRSLTLKLFQQLRARMEKGSATAGKTALGWQQDALALEHAAILKTEAGKGPGKPWRGEGEPKMATQIGVKPVEGQVRLVFFSGKEGVAGLRLDQPRLHRFSAMLALRIQQAGWDKALDLSWLSKAAATRQLAPPGKPN